MYKNLYNRDMDEVKAEEKKKKAARNRRIGMEIRFFVAVTLLYMFIYFVFFLIPWFVNLFVPINSYMKLVVGIVLALLSYILTSVIARSRGFFNTVCTRRR